MSANASSSLNTLHLSLLSSSQPKLFHEPSRTATVEKPFPTSAAPAGVMCSQRVGSASRRNTCERYLLSACPLLVVLRLETRCAVSDLSVWFVHHGQMNGPWRPRAHSCRRQPTLEDVALTLSNNSVLQRRAVIWISRPRKLLCHRRWLSR